ncbi:MAG: DUF2281 domain-containing protein [Clostridiales bacterium]|nr:DUF2281 domain-containing protein [Clostridiales bacterium]
MSAAKQILFKLIRELSDSQGAEIIELISYLKSEKENEMFKDLELASESSIDFWNNEIDDEVWN